MDNLPCFTRTFPAAMRTIFFFESRSYGLYTFRVSIPPHTFMLEQYYEELPGALSKIKKGPYNAYYLYFHDLNEKNYSHAYLPNINPRGRICLDKYDLGWAEKKPTSELLDEAIASFWSSSFNNEWSGSLRKYTATFFNDNDFLETFDLMGIISRLSSEDKDFWRDKLFRCDDVAPLRQL